MSNERVAVFLMAMGGPDSPENVEPYLLDVRGGRPTPPELVEEIRERYRATGGRSPVLDIMRSVAAKLEAVRPLKVFVGLRHWHPRIGDAWANLAATGPTRVVAICMAPQQSNMTVGKYLEMLSDARESFGGGEIPVRAVRSWATHPKLVAALTGTVGAGLAAFPEDERGAVPILFTAHSLPERVLETGDPYPSEVRATVTRVAEGLRAREGADRHHRFAFQSQGRSAEPWLGPTVEDTLASMAADGHTNVLIAPVGFLSDHVEVTYDIDIEFRALAEKLGMRLERTPMLNDSDALVDVLATLVDEQLAHSG